MMSQSAQDDVFSFADDFFQENEDEEKVTKLKPTPTKVEYTPTNQFALWFEGDYDITDAQTLKFQADYLYYKNNFKEALKTYEKCKKYVPNSNKTLAGDVQESIVWCHLKLSKKEESMKLGKLYHKQLTDTVSTAEQRTPSLFLSHRIIRAFGSEVETRNSLKELLLVHPTSAELWFRLARTYHLDNNVEMKKALRCYARSDWLARRCMRPTSSFSRERFSELCGEIETSMGNLGRKLGVCDEEFEEIVGTNQSVEELLVNCDVNGFDDVIFSFLKQE